MRPLHIIIICLTLLFISSCSKDDNTTSQQNSQQRVQQEEPDETLDTNLTPEEKFSTSILIDFLDDSEDEDLADYLETEIYKLNGNYNGASVIEMAPSLWLVMLEKDGSTKNYLLQKFVGFQSNEYYFRMKETTLTPADVISRHKVNVPAGK